MKEHAEIGQLSETGSLLIKRGSKMIIQQCPHGMACCGHHCSLFREHGTESDGTLWVLRLCAPLDYAVKVADLREK